MSTTCSEDLFSIGGRLREERDRLSLSQGELGVVMGVDRKVVRHYEENKTSPRADQLVAFMQRGADIWYVLTGQRIPLTAMQPTATYLPRDRLVQRLLELTLNEDDGDLLQRMAERLASGS